jgi:hypothetical protein
MIIFEADEEWLFRFVGVLGILDGCGSLLVPVLFKLGGRVVGTFVDDQLDRIELTCPRCGRRETYSVGLLQCSGCSLQMRVEIAVKPEKPPVKG